MSRLGILAHRGIGALFVAKLLSTTGSWQTTIALPWLVLTTTGSPAKMSAVLAAEFLGVAIVGLPSGKIVARIGLRRTLIVCDAARVPIVALVPACQYAGLTNLPVLLGLAFALGSFTAPYVSSQRLILADLLGTRKGADDRALSQANSLIDAATRIAALLGPASGGVLIAGLGAANVLWLDAATYLISCLIVTVLVPATNRTATALAQPQTSAVTGLRHSLHDPVLRRLSLTLLLAGLSIPAIFIALPVLVTRTLDGDPTTLGYLTAVNGAGLAAGSAFAFTALGRFGTHRLASLTAATQSLPLWFLLDRRTTLIAAALFVSGLATPILAATISTTFTLRTPAAIQPHVMTAATTTENLAAFIGFTTAGPALQLLGTRPVFAAIAALCCLGATTFASALRIDGRNTTADRSTRPDDSHIAAHPTHHRQPRDAPATTPAVAQQGPSQPEPAAKAAVVSRSHTNSPQHNAPQRQDESRTKPGQVA